MNDDPGKSHIHEKSELRKVAQVKRARVHGEYATEGRLHLARWAGAIIEQCELSAGAVISGYHPIRDEIDGLRLLSDLRNAGCEIGLPRMREDENALDFFEWDGGAGLEAGAYGVLEPAGDGQVIIPQLVLLPLLAFDAGGGRLGYGGGYYDRTLAQLRGQGAVIAVGVGYDEQEVVDVPRDGHDQLLDFIVTPTRFIKVHEI